ARAKALWCTWTWHTPWVRFPPPAPFFRRSYTRRFLRVPAVCPSLRFRSFPSHSSQGQSVLVHVDMGQAGEKRVDQRLAYVAVSRARYDAPVYTNDKFHLAQGLSRDVPLRSARESESPNHGHTTASAPPGKSGPRARASCTSQH